MATYLSPPSTVEVRSLWRQESSPHSLGDAGRLLDEQMDRAWLHWSMQKQPKNGSDFETDEEESDEFTYQSIKMPTVAKILVRFKKAEPLKPRHFSLDELDNDDE
jgi:hypothetical protein